jgi:hypothetical protein
MTINSNTKSFTSLSSAIKVNQNNSTDSSSKKLSDAVSVNISSNATSTTTSLINSLEEKTVIQSRNGYVNPDEKRIVKILDEHYAKMNNENKMFANPYAHSSEKYFDIGSPYYIQGLTQKERVIASDTEIKYLNGGKMFSYEDAILRNIDNSSLYNDVDTAKRKAFDREKVNTQFQSLLNKYNVTVPQDTKLSFTIDPNTLKATVSGTDDKTLAKSVEDVINTADNAKQLFLHIFSSRSDDSTQYNGDSASKFSLTQEIKNVTGYTLKDLEIKDGKFMTPDGIDVAEIYTKKINENPKMSDYFKMMNIGSTGGELKKLAKNGFDSVSDLVLSIDYQNGSFYDVKQSENFGTGKTDWIDKLQASKPKKSEIIENTETSSNISENIKETFENIPKVIKKTKKEDEKHILTKDELMLMYLFAKSDEEKKEIKDFHSLVEKIKKQEEQNKIDSASLES